ncbi:MAG: DUF1285 domain-containing protein [Pseudomonadota bacterium]
MANGEIVQAQGTSGLAALISRAAPSADGLPPVDRWQPERPVDLNMEIRADGSWYHQGGAIRREALVRLFSTVLRKDEDGNTYLVTPVEKVIVRVEDAPFIAVEMSADERDGEQVLTFRTNVGDVVEAGPDHPLRFNTDGKHDGLKPYLHVRGKLEALASRAVMHEMAALGQPQMINGTEMFAIRSAGAVFPVMTMQELEIQSR